VVSAPFTEQSPHALVVRRSSMEAQWTTFESIPPLESFGGQMASWGAQGRQIYIEKLVQDFGYQIFVTSLK
jgi:hypothetical protein